MIEFKTFINGIIETNPNNEKANVYEIQKFISDNNWFQAKPCFKDNLLFISDDEAFLLRGKITAFLCTEANSSSLQAMMEDKYPETTKYLLDFFDEESIDEEYRFYILDFLLCHLKKDIFLYSDTELTPLLHLASTDLIKIHGDFLTFFLSWLRLQTKTRYQQEYVMSKRYTMDIQNEAYEFDEYLQLLYYLMNDDYIEDNEMFQKAAESKNYTDTWLFLAIHFICSLRYTDLMQIYHPTLPYAPEEVLEKIKHNTFSDNDAKLVLLSITTRMCLLPFSPNKTLNSSGVASVKFHIPTSCETLFGKLFALAEAHRQLQGLEKEPIIRKINGYLEISRYMGDEIGSLFLESDFRSRSATKSYLQSIYMLTDDILGNEQNPNVKGYLLASLARSHKGSYGEFASTTFEYLKDAKLSGLTPEFVAYELLERGVLSFIPSTLLKMIIDDNTISNISVQNHTRLIQELNLSPLEIESIINITELSFSQATSVVSEVITEDTDIIKALHRIGNGEAFSKQPECLCLITALEKNCRFPTRQSCIGCQYEISTKSTLYLLIAEYNRAKGLYQNTEHPKEKAKYKKMLQELILPKLNEMLMQLKENYGDDVFYEYEMLIKENT